MNFLRQQSQKTVKAGDVIFREKDPGDSMYIIQAGEVEVSSRRNGEKVVLATLGSGSIFGEMSLIDGRPRSATVAALTDVECLEISRLLFEKQLGELPSWIRSFYEIMVDRLRSASRKQSTVADGAVTQIAYLLDLLLARADEDDDGSRNIVWKEAADEIAFILSMPYNTVMKAMNKITLTDLAESVMHMRKGRLFSVKEMDLFHQFCLYCRELYFKSHGLQGSRDVRTESPDVIKLLTFISQLLKDQAGASDLDEQFVRNSCEETLGVPFDHFKTPLNEIVRNGILTLRSNEDGDKYYDVNRDLLGNRLGAGEMHARITGIEKQLRSGT